MSTAENLRYFDETLHFKIEQQKVHRVLAIESSKIFYIYGNYKYKVIKLTKKEKNQLISFGQLPELCNHVCKFSRNSIIYQNASFVQVYDWVLKQVVHRVGWEGKDSVYCRNFGYWLHQLYLLIWKQSSLKFQNQYTYEIQLYIRDTFCLLKKWRIQKPTPHSICLLLSPGPQLVMCQNQGYTLLINFPDLNQTQQIKSIYSLLLSQIKQHPYFNNVVQLYITHNELIPGTKLCYDVSVDGLKKNYVTDSGHVQNGEGEQENQMLMQNGGDKYNGEDFVYWEIVQDGDGVFGVGVKDWVQLYGNKEPILIEVKAKYGRKVKMCSMLGLVMNQQVGKLPDSLFRQMCSMIE